MKEFNADYVWKLTVHVLVMKICHGAWRWGGRVKGSWRVVGGEVSCLCLRRPISHL